MQKVFVDAITAKGREILKGRADRKRLREEVYKEVRVKVRAVLKKSRTLCVGLTACVRFSGTLNTFFNTIFYILFFLHIYFSLYFSL